MQSTGANSETEIESSKPVAASFKIAPAVQDEVVLDLRSSWLEDVQAHPEKHAPKAVGLKEKLYRSLGPVLDELVYCADCLKQLGLRSLTPTPWRHTASAEQERRAEAAARFLTAAFVVVASFGTVVYVAIASHVVNLRRMLPGLQR